jgi:hypothetical protein
VKLFLGTHRPSWLRDPAMPSLFVSRTTLPTTRRYRAVVPWAMDSGGFTELQRHGRWTLTAAEYADLVRGVIADVGMVEWVAPQDWMCEPQVIAGGRLGPLTFAGTGLDVATHQRLTVENLLELRDTAPEVPWVPVLQGFTVDEYLACVDLYAAAGVDLTVEPLVGIGSVCRRQAMTEAVQIVRTVAELGIALHGFGFKQAGIAAAWPWLASADSLAWSFNARADARRGIRCGERKSCANCKHYALAWHARTSAMAGAPIQDQLWEGVA